MGSRRASGGAGEQDTGLVVGRISVSPAGAFDLLDAGVGCFGAAVGDAGGNEYSLAASSISVVDLGALVAGLVHRTMLEGEASEPPVVGRADERR